MQSDPGSGTPHTGDDDEVWRDLVARLEEADDSFLNNATPGKDAVAETPAEDTTAGQEKSSPGDEPGIADPASTRPEPKTVVDFDPLGVWHDQEAPAPREPAAENRFGPSPGATGDGSAAFGPRDYQVDDVDDLDTFIPEDLPSLSTADPAIVMSWVGAAGGPLFLVFSAIFWRQAPTLLVVAVIIAFLAGTGYLLFRLPNHRDHDSGDGAVV